MKKKVFVTYLLACALLFSACVYRQPQGTQDTDDTSAPTTQGTESTPSSSYTSPSSNETEPTQEAEQFAVVSAGTEDYRCGPCNYREITLIINSPGGEVNQGMAIYDVMNMVDCDVRTLGMGMCASMGAFLLSAGTYGKREVLPDCEIMIHQPLGGAQGQAEDIRIHTERILRTRDNLNAILATNTGRSFAEVEKATDRDHFMTAEEALAFGLIDNIRPIASKAFHPRIGT